MKAVVAAISPLLLALITACSAMRPAGQSTAAAPTPAATSAGAAATPPPPAPSPSLGSSSPSTPSPTPSVAADSPNVGSAHPTAPSAGPAPESAPAKQAATNSKTTPAPASPRPPATGQGNAAASKPAAVSPPTAASSTAAPLDIAALEQRLKDTHAIGVFTKLSLKNQVDDLLAQLRAHFRGNGGPPLSGLRQRYDLLMFKVLSLLQDSDPSLAQAIGSSREAIWGILSDPNKLAAVS